MITDAMIDPFVENPHSVTEKLAYENWERRGRPLGSPEVDWFAAERTLAQALRYRELPLYGIPLEKSESAYA
jgi:hypothetical protein